ncbi:uncharacterized protein K460DRAFT_414498 [Cucurbitaria berberidis CBS 394.84]|uniref:Aminoglycoside phosphotransferase domain-containing protein n=1 Tax=Cucurbitaria berberidis CBS 394.84 TaxID=1168544 RepID=A0A9P4LA01_9PLEO|nr:uncharacterized protein K460DRAFT_414498 [Cucurbitaria berberidis CBS 394.84]KAF1847836.1 hypothetical protein K460DRAFT_414498 [Cucurbitaria berberidis CBS 394.84]
MPSTEHGRDEEVAEQVQEELKVLNRSVIDTVTQIVNNDEPASDLWPQFRKAIFDYKKKSTEILKPANIEDTLNDSEPKAEADRDDSFKHTVPKEPVLILWPLSPALQKSLQSGATAKGVVIENGPASTLRLALSNLLVKGEILYVYVARYVVRILPDIVVKINASNDTTELHILDHIHEHSQLIPAPIALGMIMIGKWSYTFSSFIPGIPLDRIWGNLTSDKKCHVRDQLNHIFTELRGLPIPSKEGYLGGGMPPICKGGHRFKKIASVPIVSEAQFNDFILDDSWLEDGRLDYLRREMPSNNQIVMTHGDLCPLNILVKSEDTVEIAGVVDWETGGAYPEYWEYVNAFRSSFHSQDDWCLFLPEAGIGRFFDDYVKYSMIGRFARE